MTTQLCFDPDAIATWLRARRAEGIALPVDIGVPGVAEPHRLLAISRPDRRRRHAAGSSSKNARFVARLVRSGGFYRPDGLLDGLAPLIADPAAGVVGLHLYTFNAVEATEAWRRPLPRAPRPARIAPRDAGGEGRMTFGRCVREPI